MVGAYAKIMKSLFDFIGISGFDEVKQCISMSGIVAFADTSAQDFRKRCGIDGL
ncbi:MAG: hypothetical protein UIQ90_05600 [Eisenbergiella sp.]